MISFWIAAALLAAAAGAVIFWRAGRTPRDLGAEAEAEVYRRQLSELDDLRARGLLDDAGHAAARAEAGRRLLKAGETAPAPEPAAPLPGARRLVLGAVVATVAVAVGVYALVGSPTRPDQPFKARVAAWARTDPARLQPAELVILLKQRASEFGKDPNFWSTVADFEVKAGDYYAAAQDYERAVGLDPRRAEDWASLGETRTLRDEGQVSADAQAAFERALALDPQSGAARYYLGQAALAAGRRDVALGYWKPLFASLPADDFRRAELQRRIQAAEGAPNLPAGAAVPDAAAIRGMVDGLAARLEQNPDDPAGWARLIRAYGVLGETVLRQEAIAKARKLFARRPKDLALIQAEVS